jgi:hypothetical protein
VIVKRVDMHSASRSDMRDPVNTKDAGRLGGRRRAAKMTAEQRSNAATLAAAAFWAALSPAARSEEMRRRAGIRAKNAQKRKR